MEYNTVAGKKNQMIRRELKTEPRFTERPERSRTNLNQKHFSRTK